MNKLRAMLCAVLMGVVCVGCSDDGNGEASGGREAAPPTEPAEAVTAKDVVRRLLEAGKAGDVETAKKLCDKSLVEKIGQPGPRNYEFEVRDAWRTGAETATVTAWMKFPEAPEPPKEFIMTYELRKSDDGWVVRGCKMRVDWKEKGSF